MVARNILKDKLNINVSPADIIKSYRIGKKDSAHENNVRNIHVKLLKQELNNDIIATSRSVNPDKLFFNPEFHHVCSPKSQKILP